MQDRIDIQELVNCKVVSFSVYPESKQHTFLLGNGFINAGFWRLIINKKLYLTSDDIDIDGSMKLHWCENANEILRKHLFNKEILTAYATEPTGDLIINFTDNIVLQFIKNHSALESWQICVNKNLILVDAWGQLNVF